MKDKIKTEWDNINQNGNRYLNLSLIFATIILFIYCYFGTFSFFDKYLSNVANADFWRVIYHNCMAFILFFLIGLVFTKFIGKKKFSEVGLAGGKYKAGLIICAIGTVITAVVGLSSVLSPDMIATYPMISFEQFDKWYFILPYFISYALYYIGWEFLFRGVLLLGNKDKLGVLGAILLTTMLSALIHTSIGGFGKPMVETLSGVFAGLIFGYITYYTKSIWYSFYLHLTVGFFTDMFIFFLK